MNIYLWPLLGFVIAIATLYAYVLISPAYKSGRFSLPILPFLSLVILHLFIGVEIVRYVAFGIDVLMLSWAAIIRIVCLKRKE